MAAAYGLSELSPVTPAVTSTYPSVASGVNASTAATVLSGPTPPVGPAEAGNARAAAAWQSWLRALASDADAAMAASLAYESLDASGRDRWLDALEVDAPRVGVHPMALYAPLLAVEDDPMRLARIGAAAEGQGWVAARSDEARALRGVASDGARIVVLVVPLYLTFVHVLVCRFDLTRGFAWARHEPLARDEDAPGAGATIEGAALEPTPLTPVIEELAHAVLAQRRRRAPLPPALLRIASLFTPHDCPRDADIPAPGLALVSRGRCARAFVVLRSRLPNLSHECSAAVLMPLRSRTPGVLGVVAASLGLFFAAYATHDYALHLDRQLHETHCSFVPGLAAPSAGANACTAAMYSPYAALFRGTYWGGVPISLFALGAFTFFVAYATYLLAAGDAASKRAWRAYAVATGGPLAAALVMFAISALRLGVFCKLCVGMYVASALLFVSGVRAWYEAGGRARASNVAAPPDASLAMAQARAAANSGVPLGRSVVLPLVLGVLGVFAVTPALVYVASLPDYRPYLLGCGKLTETTESHGALVHMTTAHPKRPALLVVDPLCPTCKAFHERLVAEGVFENLDVTVAIFPLDNECNWMLDRAVHPGACVLAKAFLCGEKSGESRSILEWSYDHQDELHDAGKTGKAGSELVRAKVRARFPGVDACIDEKATRQRLDNVLHFAVANKLKVLTPQLYLGALHVCDEDTDLGLRYTLSQLAPEVLP